MSSAGDAVQVVEQTGAQVYLGHTRFTAPNIVDVDGRELRFRKAVIAAGSDPFVPPIDGLKTGEYLTNESVFSLTGLPARLAVIGGGPLACELAQAFHRLGSEVDLVSHTETLMPRDEPEAGELIRRRFEQEGLRLHLGYKAVRAGGGRLTVQGPAGTRELPYDVLLLGTGRNPTSSSLALRRLACASAGMASRWTSTCARATRISMRRAMWHSHKNSRTRPWQRRGCALPTRWMGPIAGHGNLSFPIAPIPTPKWPRWA
jgi:pyruvate/2-oxoglutarate dehydrogenase complex dihydrolipoamide dehydrogenase (E3) component